MMETTWEFGLAERVKVERTFQEGAARQGETWKRMDVGGIESLRWLWDGV